MMDEEDLLSSSDDEGSSVIGVEALGLKSSEAKAAASPAYSKGEEESSDDEKNSSVINVGAQGLMKLSEERNVKSSEYISPNDKGNDDLDTEALSFKSSEEAKKNTTQPPSEESSSDEELSSFLLTDIKALESKSLDQSKDGSEGSSLIDAKEQFEFVVPAEGRIDDGASSGKDADASDSAAKKASNKASQFKGKYNKRNDLALCFGKTVNNLKLKTGPKEEAFAVVRSKPTSSFKNALLRKRRQEVQLVDSNGTRYNGSCIPQNFSKKKLVDCFAIWDKEKACYVLEIIDYTFSNLKTDTTILTK